MKVVFDSNIYISAFVFPGGAATAALRHAIKGRIAVAISQPMIHEVLRILAEKFGRDAEHLSRTAVFLADLGEMVAPRARISVLADEPDNRILKCAVTGRADAIVTGDRAMLALREYRGIRLLTLREFLDVA